MKIARGLEPYEHDEQSAIQPMGENWWSTLSVNIRREKTKIKHSSFLLFLLGKLFYMVDALPKFLGISLSHYKQVKAFKVDILAEKPQWEFYKNLASQHKASLVFIEPKTPKLDTLESKVIESIHQGEILRIKFPSTFEAINPVYRASYWLRHVHQNVPMELWKHEGAARPTIVALHGYNGSMYAINRYAFSVQALYNAGCNVCLVKLPFHRAKPRDRADVINVFGHGPAYTNEVMANAVYDVRAAISYLLDNQIASKVALTGASFGGFVSALVASVDGRLAAAILLEPLVNLPDVLLEWFPLKNLFEQIQAEENISNEEFRHIYACSIALTYQPAIAKEKLLISSGMYDGIAAPRYVKLLAQHWGQCALLWKNSGHMLHTNRQPFLKETLAHLQSVNFFE